MDFSLTEIGTLTIYDYCLYWGHKNYYYSSLLREEQQ